ncbi:MAG: hypothetical protein RLZZ628_1070 [Bacteroidota bacterium]|jgi:tetratricopeptide (TPR) repeat protein/MinD-like ATPase involved in chromosome partitioning or flagellar assembly
MKSTMIVSFYSYKGGTGRTQLCSNIATYFCFKRKLKVLLWDWDLDSPGLNAFFGKKEQEMELPGTIELLQDYVHLKRKALESNSTISEADLPFLPTSLFTRLRTNPEGGRIDLIPGGNYSDKDYAYKVNSFNWMEFAQPLQGAQYIEAVKRWLKSLDYDYILVDSRTGITDYAGICNIQLPDVTVIMVTPHEQSFDGNLKIANRIENASYVQQGFRKPYILPILSRMDTYLDEERNKWAKAFVEAFAYYYNNFFNLILIENKDNALAQQYYQQDKLYIDDITIDYSSELSFGENTLFPYQNERFIEGFVDNVERIAEMLENAKTPTQMVSNLIYTDLNKKKVYIGNRQYKGKEDFKHCILWFKIEKTALPNEYTLNIGLKTNYEGTGKLGSEGENLLKTPVVVLLTDELNQALKQYQNALGEKMVLQADLSAALFEVFFKGDVKRICNDFTQAVENQWIEQLLLVISTEDSAIAQLPFEILLPSFFPFQSPQAKHLLTHSDFGLVRTPVKHLKDFLIPHRPVIAPLKVLFIAALPEDLEQYLPEAAVEQLAIAQHQLMEAMENMNTYTSDAPADKPKLFIEFLYPASLLEIEKALRAQAHDVVHLSAYSVYHEKEKASVLYLENENGNLTTVLGNELGAYFAKYPSIKLLCLNLLEPPQSHPSGNLENAIAAAMPNLITTRFTDSEVETTLFTTVFYEALIRHQSFTQALNAARERLYQDAKENWANWASAQHFAAALPITAYLAQFGEAFVDTKSVYQTTKAFYSVDDFTPNYLIGGGFIGRKRYLIEMQQAFRQGKHICLHGLGGLGKTTLAEAFIHQYAVQEKAAVLGFKHGIQINEKSILDALNKHLAKIRPEVALSMQQRLEATNNSPLDKLIILLHNYPKKEKLILFFDNCEDIQKDEEKQAQHSIHSTSLKSFLRHICLHAPKNYRLLFTSRYKMRDLNDLLTHIVLDKMSLVEQNRLLNQSPALKNIPISERSELFKQLDGHPRSYIYLEMLLRNDKTFQWSQVEKVAAKISDELLLKEVYERLSEPEQALFQWVASFQTRTHLSVLSGVCQKTIPELLPFLLTFQEWSLCQLDELNLLFTVHHITRDWMKKQMNPEKRSDFQLKIGKYFASLVGETAQLKHINLDYMLLAKDYFEKAGEIAQYEFANSSFKLHHYYCSMGFYEQATEVNQVVLEKHISDEIDSDALNNKGFIDYILNNPDKAFENLTKSLEKRENAAVKDLDRIAETYTNISLIHKVRKEYDIALKYLNDSLNIRRHKKRDPKTIAIIYNNMSQVYHAQGDYAQAEKYLRKNLKTNQSIEYQATTYSNLAAIAYDKKKYASSLDYLDKALKIQQQIGDKYEEANTLENIGDVFMTQKKWEQAIQKFLEAYILLQSNGLQESVKRRKLLPKFKIIADALGETAFKENMNKIFTKLAQK